MIMDSSLARSSLAASRLLSVKANMTPLVRSSLVDAFMKGNIFIKAESLQLSGSFKFRGAYNKLRSLLDTESFNKRVVTFSSGNHGAAVSLAASLLAIKATVVMPSDAPLIKVENTRLYGAEIVFYNRNTEDREAITRSIVEQSNATFVHPFDDADVMAGQVSSKIYVCK